MHSMDNYYVSKLMPLMAEAGVAAIANPLINIMIQGRHDTYPKRRGMTRVPEMRQHGINVCLRPGLRDGPLVLARSGRHAGGRPHGDARRRSMTGREAMRCFDAVTVNAAKIMGLEGYGLGKGCNADMVVLQARDPMEAIRLKATRLAVIRRGTLWG